MACSCPCRSPVAKKRRAMNADAASQLRETEDFLHTQIPITRAMGVRVESWDAGRLVLTAPLEINHNHLGTAFGGSLAALATLAGYACLWLELGDRAAHVVIAESALAYRRPVRESCVPSAADRRGMPRPHSSPCLPKLARPASALTSPSKMRREWWRWSSAGPLWRGAGIDAVERASPNLLRCPWRCRPTPGPCSR